MISIDEFRSALILLDSTDPQCTNSAVHIILANSIPEKMVSREAFVDILAAGVEDNTLDIASKHNMDHNSVVGHIKALMGMQAITTEQFVRIYYIRN